MELSNNIEQVIERLKKLRDAVASESAEGGGIQDALFSSLNTGRALLKVRIFNNSLDASGEPFGNYHGNKTKLTKKKFSEKRSDLEEEKERKKAKKNFNKAVKSDASAQYTEYEKFRLGKGRQIEKKDLQLSGSLASSVETVKKEGNKVVIAISNKENAKLAGYQESQIANIRDHQPANKKNSQPARIFSLSKSEFEEVQVQGKLLIVQLIKSKIG